MSKNAVATQTEKTAMAVPDFMKGAVGAGNNIESTDLELPRIKLISPINPEVEDGIPAGDFYHHIAQVSLSNKMTVIPLYVFKSYMLWRPRKDGGGLLARADDGFNWNVQKAFDVKLDGKKAVTWVTKATVEESGLHLWGSSDPGDDQSQPAATKMINVVAWIEEYPELSPVVIPLQKGHLKAGTRLVSLLAMGAVPCFGRRFEFSSEKTNNRDGEEYYNYKIRGIGFVQDEDAFNHYKSLNESMSKLTIKVGDAEGMERDEASSSDDVSDSMKDRV